MFMHFICSLVTNLILKRNFCLKCKNYSSVGGILVDIMGGTQVSTMRAAISCFRGAEPLFTELVPGEERYVWTEQSEGTSRAAPLFFKIVCLSSS